MTTSDGITGEALVDDILAAHATALGGNFAAYRNRAPRVLHFSLALAGARSGDGRSLRHRSGLARPRHSDRGYAGLSGALSRALAWGRITDANRAEPTRSIEHMIESHHALTGLPGDGSSPIEIFRRAYLVDLSLRLVRFGRPRGYVGAVCKALPNSGFHRFLIGVLAGRLLSHPLRIAPMSKARPAARE